PDQPQKSNESHNGKIKGLLERKVTGLRFYRTIATDDVVLGELIEELNRRHVSIPARATPSAGAAPSPATTPSPSSNLPDVVLLTEWDAGFGRSLGTTFIAKAYGQQVGEILKRRQSVEPRPRSDKTRRLHIYRYLRGIDGQLPGDITQQ